MTSSSVVALRLNALANATRATVIERDRTLVAEQPGDLRKQRASLFQILEREASPHAKAQHAVIPSTSGQVGKRFRGDMQTVVKS